MHSQGCYSQEGDIVVLCAYLGQLAKVRDALSHEVAVVIDERDQAALEDHEGEKDFVVGVEHVKVSKRVSDGRFDEASMRAHPQNLGTAPHRR